MDVPADPLPPPPPPPSPPSTSGVPTPSAATPPSGPSHATGPAAPPPPPTHASGPGSRWPFAPPTEAERAAMQEMPPADLREAVIDVLLTCYDPEIPVNIYDLGLIYGIDVGPDKAVTIQMTLTSPACPVAGSLPPEVEQKVRAIPGVGPVKVDLVWEPPWGKHLLSEAARLQLGMDGY